jgi:octaheme c-type cytochrome (tetrathionate reductase family)
MRGTARRCLTAATLLAVLLAAVGAWAAEDDGNPYGSDMAKKVAALPEQWITADHSKHEILKQPFTSGPEVTRACLSCHNEAALQMHQTIHWTWICPADRAAEFGKAGITLNNFCIGIHTNEPRCTSCHAGYGYTSKDFDFSSQEKVDCLVCHEQTGTYKKFPAGAGHPVDQEKVFPGNGKTYYPPDWNKVAQSVGRPGRKNCGVCHFYGGGGDGVKHGDLDSSLASPSHDLDVHMNAEGANFDCVRCHTTKGHKIAGRCYKVPASQDRRSLIQSDLISRITCVSCHTHTPHEPGHKANDHVDTVACQTCHIPRFARVLPTKMWWDWSKAGMKKNGKPFAEDGPHDRHSYATKKGEFRWDKNVVPEYYWFNGTMTYVTLKDEIDPSAPVPVNRPVGSRDDPDSRIYPFKVHRGKQPYDSGNNRMVVPHLFGKDEDAYWKGYQWGPSIEKAMASVNEMYPEVSYSGEWDFVETAYHYPTTHMVAPKEDAVACGECHSRGNSRLADLAGFYMPARDNYTLLDVIGWLVVVGSLIGVILHGFARFVAKVKE